MRLAVVLAALAGMAPAAAGDPETRCIVGDDAIGCHAETTLVELTGGDAGALRRLVRDRIDSGQCRLFAYGERVRVTSAHDERMQFLRPGDRTTWWMPSSWLRPASDCADTPTAAALRHKLGLPEHSAPAEDERFDASADERTAQSQDRDDDGVGEPDDGAGDDVEAEPLRRHDRRPAPGPRQPLRSSRYAHPCVTESAIADAYRDCTPRRR